MADNSREVNVGVSAPQPQITVTEAHENAEKCEKEQSEIAAKESTEKVEAAVEKPESTDNTKTNTKEQVTAAEKLEKSDNTKTDVKEQSAAAENPEKIGDTKIDAKDKVAVAEKAENTGDTKSGVEELPAAARGEYGESHTTLLQDWERLETAIKQPAPYVEEPRTLGSVEAGQPRAPRRRRGEETQGEEQTALCRRWPLGEYWKAILAFTIVMLSLVALIYTHRYLYRSETHEERVYNAKVALISGGVAGVLGLFALYSCLKSCHVCCNEYFSRALEFVVSYQNRPYEPVESDVESQIAQAEKDADNAATKRSGETSTSPKESVAQSTSSEKHAIFSSPISDEASSRKISEVASAVTSIVSETLSKGAKEKLTESSDSTDGSTEVSGSSTESSSDTLTESGEIRRRNVPSGEKNGATRSSDEESAKKE